MVPDSSVPCLIASRILVLSQVDVVKLTTLTLAMSPAYVAPAKSRSFLTSYVPLASPQLLGSVSITAERRSLMSP